jgi:hypothetical protein
MKHALIPLTLCALLICVAATPPSNPPADPLPLNSVWHGSNTMEAYATRPVEHRHMTMKITRREQNKFAADCVITFPDNTSVTYDVEGLVEDGKIQWKTTKVKKGEGDGPPPAEGEISDKKLQAHFDGAGRRFTASAEVAPQLRI